MIASIDTVSIKTREAVTSTLPKGVIKTYSRDDIQTFRINPNAYAGFDIYNLSTYEDVMQEIVNLLGLSDFWYSRIDIRLDSYIAEYQEVEKINKLLILLLYCQNPSTNNLYGSIHGMTGEKIDSCYRGNTVQVEAYDKAREEPSGMVLSRLELRSTKLLEKTRADVPAVLSHWERRLDRCLTSYDIALEKKTEALKTLYFKGRAAGVYNSPSDFVQKNIGDIYTPQQMDALFTEIGEKTQEQARRARYNLKKHHPDLSLDYISKKTLASYISEIQKKMSEFSQK